MSGDGSRDESRSNENDSVAEPDDDSGSLPGVSRRQALVGGLATAASVGLWAVADSLHSPGVVDDVDAEDDDITIETDSSGDDCAPSGTPEVLVNQGGYDLGRTKRFTAPGVADGTTFEIEDTCYGSSLYSGTVSGEKGDFSDFDPSDPGPYRIRLDKSGRTVRSNAFRIDDHVTELTSYRNAVEFFTGSRTKWGDYAALPSDDSNYPVSRGVAWRDQDGYSFILRTLADLYMANPEATERITVDSSDVPPDLSSDAYQYKDMPTSVPSDTPEVVRLLWWGAHVYLKAGVNYSLMKTELAAFLRVYPHIDEWIPQSLYDDVKNHLFPIWDQSTGDKHYSDYYYYTDHSKDLTTTYTQVGTSKGEFPPGFSIRGNLDMYKVAQREGRSDAQTYLDAAVEQAKWIVNNLDETDPMSHKGQRMSEHVTLTGLSRLVRDYPNEAPSGTWEWIESWASEMDTLSDNLWDFRRWDLDNYWIHQELPDYPSDDTINEPGNVAGFPAPALAAANVLDETNTSLADTLRDIAQAHVDNTFGRNPTGRHFCHRATNDAEGFEGVERGWYSEYDGIGDLNGVVGVLDGSPKDAHYPDNPGAGDTGWTEGWVAFNSAWNAGLSWLTLDDSDIEILDSSGNDVEAVGSSETITVSLRVAVDNESSTNETVEAELKVDSDDWESITLTRVTVTSSTFETTVDLGSQGASDGETVSVRYGHAVFERTESVAVGSADTSAPTIPGNLSSPAQTASTVDLDWDASSDSGGSGLDHYDIYKDGDKDSQVAAGTMTTTVTGLSSNTSYDFKVVAVDGAGNESSDSNTISVSTTDSNAVVVDNDDSPGVSKTGIWKSSTFEDNYVGSDYLHDDNANKGSKSVTFTPDLDTGGDYEVYAYWNSSEDRATSVPIDIDYDVGSDTVSVDQTQNGGQYNKLGTYSFTSGTGESVTIRNDNTSDYVIADAVKFVLV